MSAARRQSMRAALAMLAAIAVFSLMDAGLKQLSLHYPPFQVAALRGASSLPFVLVWAMASTGLLPLLRVRWPLHLLRGVLGVLMMAGFAYGLKRLPLTTAYSIVFVAPLLIAALSVPLLGERVGPRRWTAIAIGMLGVLVLLRPGGEGMVSAAALALLGAAAMYALAAITVRILSRTDSTQSMVFWLMAMMAAGGALLAAPGWVAVAPQHLWIIASVGAAGALGQYLITEAFRMGEASLVAPIEYTALVWGVLLDVTLWGVLPGAGTWIGAAIIIASGLYLIRRERIHVEAEHP